MRAIVFLDAEMSPALVVSLGDALVVLGMALFCVALHVLTRSR
jgi:hypothetical protein